jgi:cytochrome b involved in lipid metabolism
MNRQLVPGQDGKSLHAWILLAKKIQPSMPRKINLLEVEKHRALDDFWCILDGFVYNLTPFLTYHPGGRKCHSLSIVYYIEHA